MVFQTSFEEVGVLPPILPVILPRRPSSYNFRPVASLDGPGDASSKGSNGFSSKIFGSSSGNKPNMSFPSARKFAFGMTMGASTLFGNAGFAHAKGPGKKEPNNVRAPSKPGQKRILIAMSNTGGGHRASAEAIKQAFQEKYGDKYEIYIVDMWKEHTPAPWNSFPDSYSFLVKHSVLWRLSYESLQPSFLHRPYLWAFAKSSEKMLNKALDFYDPDLLVSVHPLMQHVHLHCLKERMLKGKQKAINFATVVTDFTTCHNTWFHEEITRCFVPTEFCADLARQNGLQDGQIILHGLPIRPVFSKPLPSQPALRSKLGMAPKTPAVLLVGGGEGMGALEQTVDDLALTCRHGIQVVVICGRNQALLDTLSAKNYPSGMKVHARGFVDNIHEYMAASDAIITKAGPGTIAEALISGLPILLNGNVPCQEEGNIPYVVDNHCGQFETNPEKIALIMQKWLLGEQKAELKEMAARAKALGKPQGVYQIVKDLADLCDNPDYEYGPAKYTLQAPGAAGAVPA
eukprot:gene10017-7904_t